MGELERRLAAALDSRKFRESGAEDEAAPAWPSESEEAAFLAETGAPDKEAVPTAAPRAEINAQPDLPPLDDLVGRIPAEVRATLDELFRARFIGVKRASEKDLEPHTS